MGGGHDFKHQEASSIRWLLSPNLKGVSPVNGESRGGAREREQQVQRP